MISPEAHKDLSAFGKKVVVRARRGFSKQRFSGKGSKSIGYEIKSTKSGFDFYFKMLPYVWFQDAGVRGAKSGKNKSQPIAGKSRNFKYTNKMPPSSVFDKWGIRRGLAPRDEKGRFLSRKSLNFAVARKIYLYGIRPKLFFTKAFEKELAFLPAELADAFGEDAIKNILK